MIDEYQKSFYAIKIVLLIMEFRYEKNYSRFSGRFHY